jgi:hypothetical protein
MSLQDLTAADLKVMNKVREMDMAAVECDPGVAFELLAILDRLKATALTDPLPRRSPYDCSSWTQHPAFRNR